MMRPIYEIHRTRCGDDPLDQRPWFRDHPTDRSLDGIKLPGSPAPDTAPGGGRFLEHQWPFRGERAYLPTKRAVARAGDELPPLNRITLGSYVHDLQLVDLAHWLVKETNGAFTPERRLRHERGLIGVGVAGHVADGLLDLGNGKPIAIELELSTKAKRRLAKIIRGYLSDLSIAEVWYFTGSLAVRSGVERAVGDHAFIKIHDWAPSTTTNSRPEVAVTA